MEVYYSKDKKTCSTNSILETVEMITRNQRSTCSTCANCVSCNGCFFNTIPIRLTHCCNGTAVSGLVGAGGVSTEYFRIECITCERFIKLRLLTVTSVEGEIVVTGTNYTMVVDLDCVGAIQCFEPVNILGCTAPTT